jgi:hypothetical protein
LVGQKKSAAHKETATDNLAMQKEIPSPLAGCKSTLGEKGMDRGRIPAAGPQEQRQP